MKHLINAIYLDPHNDVDDVWLCIDVTDDEITFDIGRGRTRTRDLRAFIMALAMGGFVVVGRLESHSNPPCPVSPDRARQLDAMTMNQINHGLLVGDLDANDRAYVLGTTKFG